MNIGVNVPKELRARLEELAASCKPPKTLSAYVREVLEASADEGIVYEQAQRALFAAAEDRPKKLPMPRNDSEQTGA